MLNVQVEHLDDLVAINADRFVRKLDHLLFKVLFPNIPCEICNHSWDSISPCAMCNATRAMPSFRI